MFLFTVSAGSNLIFSGQM